MTPSSHPLMHPSTLRACCPSCLRTGMFTLLGVQTWPARVAQAAGLPEAIGQYRCEACQSTISELDLLKNSA